MTTEQVILSAILTLTASILTAFLTSKITRDNEMRKIIHQKRLELLFTAPIYEINCFVKIQAYRIGMIFLDKTGSGKLVSPLPVMNWQGAFYVCTGSLTEYLMFAAITTHPAIRPGPRWLLRWSLPQEWVHRHRTERTGHG